MAASSLHACLSLLVVASAALPLRAQAAEPLPPPTTQVVLEARHEALDGARHDWRALRLGVVHGAGWAPAWHGALVHESRFGLDDAGLELGGAWPLDDRWMLQADVASAPGARFLPQWDAELRVVRRLADGWLVSGSVRHARYRSARVPRASLDVERYVGHWRFAYGIDVARLRGAPVGRQRGGH